MKKKISKSVILSIAGGVVLLLQAFGVKVNLPYVNELIEAVCAVLIVLGIVSTSGKEPTKDLAKDKGSEKKDTYDKDNKDLNSTNKKPKI